MIRNDYNYVGTISIKARPYTKQFSGERTISPSSPKQAPYRYMQFQNPGVLSPDYVKPASPTKKFLKDLFSAIFKKVR